MNGDHKMIKLKRIYLPYSQDDGFRILVERLWPRGIKKSEAHIDLWLSDIAPSNDLRKWFNHEDSKWDGFNKKYYEELSKNNATETLKDIIRDHDVVTFLYSSRNEMHNNAVSLKYYVEKYL